MPAQGFPSSFESPGEADVERYRKMKAVADPNGNAAPNEMAIARKEMEKLEARFPSIRAVSAIPAAGTPAGGFRPSPNGVNLHPNSTVMEMLGEILGTVRNVANARILAHDAVEIVPRAMQDGRVRFTVTLSREAFDSAIERLSELERAQFASAIGERLKAEILATIALNEP